MSDTAQTRIGSSRGVERVKRARFQWRVLYQTWWAIHYGMGITGIVCAAVSGIATINSGWLGSYNWVFGVTAAVSTSLVTFLGPVQKAERYWKAFHMVDQALLEYEGDHINSRRLALAMREARHFIIVGIEMETQETP